ncbi:MAG: DUF998 domain-containing protein [Haloglomus sp.]
MASSHARFTGKTAALGLASVAVLAVAVAVAAALDPTVSRLPVRARLSDLGRPGAPGALVFDLGLVLAGFLGLGFVLAWIRMVTAPLDRAAAALAGATFLGLAVAGLFPEPAAAHVPFLAAAYLAAWTAPLLDAYRLRHTERSTYPAGDVGEGESPRAGRPARALLAATAVVALLWVIRAFVQATTFLLSGATSALLLAELATLALFCGWIVFRIRHHRMRRA